MYDRLFLPLRIGPRETGNRIIFGSHTTNLARHNQLSWQHQNYYASRAAGGAGMIVLEEHIVHPSDLPYESAVLGYLPETPQAIAAVTEQIHAYNALAIVQLNHNGQQSSSDHHQRELWAPSPVPNVSSREVPKAMEQGDIRAVIDGFAQVARHAVQGEADGVELQVADSSLLRQFLSPLTNQRTDQYGGLLENRLRFVQETIEAVDAVLGAERVLGLRFCADELAPWAGLTPEQGIEIARILSETGRIDYMTITMGSIFSTQMFPFHASMHVSPGYAVHLAAAIKAAINVPVFAAGRIMNAAQAERILREEQADGVELMRPLIADPNLPQLSRANLAARVRPCIACNQGCQVRSIINATISCNVNPDVTNAHPLPLSIKAEPTRGSQQPSVWVIGSGPAGLEAARTAALRGYAVALYEREETLGGTVALAAKGPGRSELQFITDYLQAELKHLGVTIYTGTEVTAEMVLEHHPATVIVATGAHPGTGLLPIPGHDLPHVTDIRKVLGGRPVEGQNVLMIDETGSHGVLSVVELLAAQGKRVEVVSEDWYIGHDLASTHDIVQWMQRILAHGVMLTTHTTVTRIEPGQVILTDRFAEGEQVRPVDTVVLGTYEQPAQELYLALKGRVPRLFRIGDCVAPRRIEQAILEGRRVGEQI
ncbi:MAG TPA: FAD-dependent oxidoreductase [Ktedonobacteraceae bacterium]|nr:FAD-dependent oxidoreductase [Ktedonobacteraceae bacterium]